MSDYTPDSLNESEPSMEDILASIRKIIADDDGGNPAPLREIETGGSNESLSLYNSEPEALSGRIIGRESVSDAKLPDWASDVLPDVAPAIEAESPLSAEPLELDASVDFDLSEPLDLEIAPELSAEIVSEKVMDDEGVLDLTENLIVTDSAELDMEIEAAPTIVPALVAGAITANSDDLDMDFDEDFDLVLGDEDFAEMPAPEITADDMEEELLAPVEAAALAEDVAPEAEMVIDPAADLLTLDDGQNDEGDDLSEIMADIDAISEDDFTVDESIFEPEDASEDADDLEAELSTSSGDADIDLVKSLLADLTDDDLDGDYDIEEDGFDDVLESAIEAGETNATTGIAATDLDLDDGALDPETLDDDLASIMAQSSADIEAAKQDVSDMQGGEAPLELSVDDIIDDAPEGQNAAIGALSAVALAMGVAGGAGAPGIAMADDETEITAEIETQIEIDEIAETQEEPQASLSPNNTQTEDSDMPRIVKTETITNEETSSAASGAFASLNQVVEEKSVESESGPRIGDLVQEALKPMLQAWLDKNLKGIVDRAVAKEIKRISSGK